MSYPHIDTGDHVIGVNASKVFLTSARGKKIAYSHTGYRVPAPAVLNDVMATTTRRPSAGGPGMCPGHAGSLDAEEVKVSAGPTHPQDAQMPRRGASDGCRRPPALVVRIIVPKAPQQSTGVAKEASPAFAYARHRKITSQAPRED